MASTRDLHLPRPAEMLHVFFSYPLAVAFKDLKIS